MTDIANTEQAEYWSGPSGETWVAKQAFFDALLTPVLDVLMEEVPLIKGQRVLDIGCGTGASLLALADAVGPDGHVTGVDVSTPMLTMARDRVQEAGLTQVTCIEADAQMHDMSGMGVDHVVSRFGVMFFENPRAALRNIAMALRPGGRISFVTWAGLADNPWFRMPAEAAKTLVGAPPPADPRAPGPMAFSEQDYVTVILAQAGLVEITARHVAPTLTPAGTRAEVATFAASEGPASRILREMGGTEADSARVAEMLFDQFQAFETPNGVRVPSRLNLFSASSAG